MFFGSSVAAFSKFAFDSAALALEKGIPFATGSDAHSHAQLAENYDRLAEKMRQLGVREVCTFQRNKPAGLGVARNLDRN